MASDSRGISAVPNQRQRCVVLVAILRPRAQNLLAQHPPQLGGCWLLGCRMGGSSLFGCVRSFAVGRRIPSLYWRHRWIARSCHRPDLTCSPDSSGAAMVTTVHRHVSNDNSPDPTTAKFIVINRQVAHTGTTASYGSDQPRIRGEHAGVFAAPQLQNGSSPPPRGIGNELEPSPIDSMHWPENDDGYARAPTSCRSGLRGDL